MSETETRPSPNAVESETRPRPPKSGLKTKTGLEYSNTRIYFWANIVRLNGSDPDKQLKCVFAARVQITSVMTMKVTQGE